MNSCGFRDIVRKAQAGDTGALDELFRFARPVVERIVRARTTPPNESVNDHVQNTCARIFEKLDQFDGARTVSDDEQCIAVFVGWVRQVTLSVLANAPRGRERFRKVRIEPAGSTNTPGNDPPAPDGTPSTYARADEESKLVLAAVDALPDPINREIVKLRFFDGLSLREITEQLSLTYDVVRERYKTSMRRLRRELESLE